MPNTITAYNTFVANSKARSAEVNTNFNNYRGDLLPINANTASASDGAHDLGTDEHRWKDVYCDTIDIEAATSTVDFKVVPDQTQTLGAVDFKFGASTIASWDANGLKSGIPSGFVTAAMMGSGVMANMNSVTFTASDTWTVPTGVNVVFCKVVAGGGGGGSGGGGSGGDGGGAGGGASGGMVVYPMTSTPAGSFTITIGAKGNGGAQAAGGASGNAGTNGGNSVVTHGSFSVLVTGGVGGSPGLNGTAGGTGGAGGVTGTLKGSEKSAGGAGGGAGANGVASELTITDTFATVASGGAGGGGGNGGNSLAGPGHSKGGTGGSAGNSGAAGTAPTGFGTGGAGGGGAATGAGFNGGGGQDGTAGIIELYWNA